MSSLPGVGSILDDRYEILSVAGSGGMGTVYRARQLGLERIVAIKVLDPLLVADRDSFERFEREAKAIALLHNPHIATFYSFGVLDSKLPYIAMEFLEGTSLKDEIYKAPIYWTRALEICRQVCEAVEDAHAAGIIHRDLKPNNIILLPGSDDKDFVKVVDFGLARTSEDGEQGLTKTGQLLGTIHYLSPEQSRGMRANESSDLYAIGCILYEMICASPPFDGDNPIGILHKHVHETAPSPSTRAQVKYPAELDDLIFTCLAKKPEDRFDSVREMREDLENLLSGKTDLLVSGSIKTPKKNFSGKKQMSTLSTKMLFVLPAVLLISVIFGFCFVFYTEPGLLIRAQWEIGSNDKQSLLKWLSISEELEVGKGSAKTGGPGGSGSAIGKIQHLIVLQLKKQNSEDDALARLYLDLANQSLANHDETRATFWCKRALFSLFHTRDPINEARYMPSFEDAFSRITALAKKLKVRFNRSQTKDIIQNLSKTHFRYTGYTTLVDLLQSQGVDKSNYQKFAKLLMQRDTHSAELGYSVDLISNYRETEKLLRLFDGPNTLLIPLHAFKLAKTAREARSIAADRAVDQLTRIGLAALKKAGPNDLLITCWARAADLARSVGDPQLALSCARTFKGLAESETNAKSFEDGEAKLFLAWAMIENGQFEQALPYFDIAMDIFKDDSRSHEGPSRYSEAAAGKARALQNLNREAELNAHCKISAAQVEKLLVANPIFMNDLVSRGFSMPKAAKLKARPSMEVSEKGDRAYDASHLYWEFARVYEALGKYDEQGLMLQKALDRAQKFGVDPSWCTWLIAETANMQCQHFKKPEFALKLLYVALDASQSAPWQLDGVFHITAKLIPCLRNGCSEKQFADLMDRFARLADRELASPNPRFGVVAQIADLLMKSDQRKAAARLLDASLTKMSPSSAGYDLLKATELEIARSTGN